MIRWKVLSRSGKESDLSLHSTNSKQFSVHNQAQRLRKCHSELQQFVHETLCLYSRDMDLGCMIEKLHSRLVFQIGTKEKKYDVA